jgi:hypothetical protein
MILVARMFAMIHPGGMFLMPVRAWATPIVGTLPVSGDHNAAGGGEEDEHAA